MEKILTFIRNMCKIISNCSVAYHWVSYSNDILDVYYKSFVFPFRKKSSVCLAAIKAIYVMEMELHLYLELFTKDNKRLVLWQPSTVISAIEVKNWEDLIDIIAKKYPDFNWNNYNLCNSGFFEAPVLCWHSEKVVPDLQTITDKDVISVVYKESGEKYVFDDYISLLKTSKHV